MFCMSVSLWERFDPFPAHVPSAVFRESRIFLGTSVPTGAHESDCCEKTAVAGEVAAQTVILIVMPVGKICVCALIHHDSVDSLLRVTETCGTHGGGRIVPTPSFIPIPIVINPVKGRIHDVGLHEVALR